MAYPRRERPLVQRHTSSWIETCFASFEEHSCWSEAFVPARDGSKGSGEETSGPCCEKLAEYYVSRDFKKELLRAKAQCQYRWSWDRHRKYNPMCLTGRTRQPAKIASRDSAWAQQCVVFEPWLT